MNKPKLEEFVEPIYNENRLVAQGINFSKYAFALERYIRELEKAWLVKPQTKAI